MNGYQHVFNRGCLPLLSIFKTQNFSRSVERLISQDTSLLSLTVRVGDLFFLTVSAFTILLTK